MKINRLEAHDRLLHLKKEQSLNVFQGAEDCLKNNPLSLAYQEKSPYIYIFAHPRSIENGNKALYWQPRLSKPSAQTNSYLFRAQSKTDLIEVCWLIPPREFWPQYKAGNVTENDLVEWSVKQFRYNKIELEKPHADDMSEERMKLILQTIVNEKKQEKIKLMPSEDFSL